MALGLPCCLTPPGRWKLPDGFLNGDKCLALSDPKPVLLGQYHQDEPLCQLTSGMDCVHSRWCTVIRRKSRVQVLLLGSHLFFLLENEIILKLFTEKKEDCVIKISQQLLLMIVTDGPGDKPNLNQPPLSPLFDPASSLGLVFSLPSPVLATILLSYFSKYPPKLF